MTDTGLKLFTNDLDSSAEGGGRSLQDPLADRAVLPVRFHGRSENAVQLQIAAAVITYLLWKLSHTAAVFLTALRNALFHRIKLETLGGRIERRHASPDQVPSAQ
jgi:hypothetical protein